MAFHVYKRRAYVVLYAYDSLLFASYVVELRGLLATCEQWRH